MLLAWKRVKTNKGAAGMDGMSIEAFPEFVRHHWERIRSALEEGTYHPAAVLRVMIPKATGGQRPLGIPTVLDRVIQQAIAQVIGPLFDAHFSTHSYGFRPQRSARMATPPCAAMLLETVEAPATPKAASAGYRTRKSVTCARN
jgi:RNA-directed DNA polymerase